MSKSAKTTAIAIDPKTTEVLQLDLETFERKDLDGVTCVNVSGSQSTQGADSLNLNLGDRRP
jgi:hypothetical protein